jgi:hypothetical protein
MIMPREQWNVTYSILTSESAENGDYEECDFVVKNNSLRDAVKAAGGKYASYEPNCYPCRNGNCSWITNYEYREDYSDGSREERSLHFPKHITLSSRNRLLRYLDVNCGR